MARFLSRMEEIDAEIEAHQEALVDAQQVAAALGGPVGRVRVSPGG